MSPAKYRNLPANVRSFLEQHGCQLPEASNWGEEGRQWNVTSGQFVRPGQTDWAALCIVKDKAQVLVLWGGKTECPSEIHSGWPLQIKFSQEPAGGLSLTAVGPKEILAYRQFFGDTQTNPVTHAGIQVEDEQAGLIYYCDGKNWLELQGND